MTEIEVKQVENFRLLVQNILGNIQKPNIDLNQAIFAISITKRILTELDTQLQHFLKGTLEEYLTEEQHKCQG